MSASSSVKGTGDSRNNSPDRSSIPTVYDPAFPSKVNHPQLGVISAAFAAQLHEQKIESQRNADLSVAASVANLRSTGHHTVVLDSVPSLEETYYDRRSSNANGVGSNSFDDVGRTEDGSLRTVGRTDSIMTNDSRMPLNGTNTHQSEKGWIGRLGRTIGAGKK